MGLTVDVKPLNELDSRRLQTSLYFLAKSAHHCAQRDGGLPRSMQSYVRHAPYPWHERARPASMPFALTKPQHKRPDGLVTRGGNRHRGGSNHDNQANDGDQMGTTAFNEVVHNRARQQDDEKEQRNGRAQP
jgi:hypothetical protein